MLHHLKHSIVIKATLEDAWKFFSNPKNLATITPPELNMRIVSPPEDSMYEGQIIAYHVHPFFSIPLLWVTEITNVREPFLFIDEQRYGPYRMWHHQHRFHRVGDGVQVEDTIDYIMPAGPLGLLIRKLFVAKQLETVFSYRARVLAERFGVLYS